MADLPASSEAARPADLSPRSATTPARPAKPPAPAEQAAPASAQLQPAAASSGQVAWGASCEQAEVSTQTTSQANASQRGLRRVTSALSIPVILTARTEKQTQSAGFPAPRLTARRNTTAHQRPHSLDAASLCARLRSRRPARGVMEARLDMCPFDSQPLPCVRHSASAFE